MPPKPLPVDYGDDWYASKTAAPAVAEVMNRHLGLPPDLLAGILPAEAIGELTAELRLKPASILLDLACGRAGYGLAIARGSEARLIGIDVSAEALAQAQGQAVVRPVPGGRRKHMLTLDDRDHQRQLTYLPVQRHPNPGSAAR